jgi:DNA-binding transcriptional LysR family regulator
MELNAIRSFDAVAQTQSLSQAARRVHLAQPALSRRVHALERELGVSLLTRHAKGVSLTPAGAVFAGAGRQLLQDIATALDNAEATAAGRRGRTIIAATRAAMARGLPVELQDSLRRDHPEVMVSVEDFEQPTATVAVAERRADLAICSDSTLPAGLVSEPLWSELIDRVIVSANHPLAARASVTLSDLRAFPFVFAPGSAGQQTAEQLEAALRRAGLRSRVMALEGDVRTAHVAVATQRAWTLVTRSRAQAPPDGTVVVPVDGITVSIEMIVVWRRDDRRALTQTILRRLRELAGSYSESRVRAPANPATFARPRAFRAPRPPGTVPSDLRLRHLRALVSVATTPSISRAARQLGISQPALSRQLRAFEQAVGLSLFERSARGVTPTPAGAALTGEAPALLAAAARIAREVDRVKRSIAGRCLIGTVATAAASGLVSSVSARCAELYPELQLVIREVPTAEQGAALANAEIDLGLAHAMPKTRAEQNERIVTTRLFEDRLERALLPEQHPLAGERAIDARQLAETPFLFMERAYQPEFYDRVFGALADLGLEPRVDATYNALPTAVTLVVKGKGWTLGFDSQSERPPVGTRSVRITGFSLPFGIDLLSRRGESAPTVVAVESLFLDPQRRRRKDASPRRARTPRIAGL